MCVCLCVCASVWCVCVCMCVSTCLESEVFRKEAVLKNCQNSQENSNFFVKLQV